MAHEDGFPLFQLSMVLLPSESTVLHVFEEQYKALANHCIDTNSEFAVVLTDEDEPSEFGCAARIDRVLERFDDGRMNIVVTGVEPVRLVELEQDRDYPSAVVERLADAVPPGGADPDLLARTRDAYATLVEAITDEAPDVDELESLHAYEMAAQVNLDSTDKQLLLETRDENTRLTSLEDIFTTGAKSVTETRELARRAKTNGHGRYPRATD